MAHSKSKNWIHLIIGVKNREPLLNMAVEAYIHNQLRQQLIGMNCYVDSINGIADHVHLLFLLHPQKALSEVVKQIKGANSHALNQSDLMREKFAWAVGYGAFSVSESGVPTVRKYIQNQKEHHRKKTYEEEYQAFLHLHRLEDENG